MSKPNLEDGYIRIANELYDVILAYDFTLRELKIVLAIMRKTYGFNKKNDVISIRQIANMTGFRFQHVAKTLTKLITNGVVLLDGSLRIRRLGINKEYKSWINYVTKTVTSEVVGCNQNSDTDVTKTVTVMSPKRLQQKTKDKLKTRSKEKNIKKRIKSDEVIFPDWLDRNSFKNYIENRIFMKSPMSPNAQNLAIKKLRWMIDSGENQTELIETAIERNWKSFYPSNTNQMSGNENATRKPEFKTVGEQVRDELKEVYDALHSGGDRHDA